MKFRIRYADQVVGAFVIVAMALLAFLVVAVGANQRWFSRDYEFYSRFSSGSGLSTGTALVLAGFQIGRIDKIELNADNEADIVIKIYDTYIDKVHMNSILEFVTSPIGLGSQLLFHPGKSDSPAPEKSYIPSYDTAEGKRLVEAGLVNRPPKDDTITRLLSNINPLVENVDATILELKKLSVQIGEALQGEGDGPIAAMLTDASASVHNVKTLVSDVGVLLDDTKTKAFGAVDEALEIVTDVKDKTFGAVDRVLDTVDDVKEKTYSVVDDASGLVLEVKDKAFSVIDETKDKALGVVDQALEIVDETKDKAFSVVDQAQTLVDDTKRVAFGAIDETKAKAFAMVDKVDVLIDETKGAAFALIDETKDKAFETVDEVNKTIQQSRDKALDLVDGLYGVVGEVKDKAFELIDTAEEATKPLLAKTDTAVANVVDITANLKATTEALRDPTGLVPKLLDPKGSLKTLLDDGDRLFDRVEASLGHVEGALKNLKDSTAALSGQMPKIVATIEEVRGAIVKAQDVLEGLKNNPLLRGGITEQVEPQAAPTSLRTTDF